APVLTELVIAQLLGNGDGGTYAKERAAIDVEGWRNAVGVTGDRADSFRRKLEDPGELEATLRRIIAEALRDFSSALGPIIAWIFEADIADLLSLRPPNSSELRLATKAANPDMEIVDRYRWIVDRFSTTFFTQWTRTSLHLEYRWSQGL